MALSKNFIVIVKYQDVLFLFASYQIIVTDGRQIVLTD